MSKLANLLAIVSIAVMSGCKEESDPILAREPTLEDIVVANCYLVQEAAEAFASENTGLYPTDISLNQSAAGHTLVDLLPDSTYLVNPSTGLETEPWDGAAANPGETGYTVRSDTTGAPVGYTITGFGNNEIILTLVK